MATQYSIDLFLEDVSMVVIFPNNGEVVFIPNYNSAGRRHEGGDIVYVDRALNAKEQELAVILGWGETKEEAVLESKLYIERVMKWHGQEPGSYMFMGFDVSESQVFTE